MDESVEAIDIPGQHNEESFESEVIREISSGDPEDHNVDASSCPEVTKYQDAAASAHTGVP